MKLLCLIAIVAAPLGGCASSALHEVAQRAMDGCQAVRHLRIESHGLTTGSADVSCDEAPRVPRFDAPALTLPRRY
ncbi:hypothetical protein [Sphaerotilus sp.]|uniref:hypothetical protein n=1 Tax=Sphaerotilus sp. TaxID=2093942 RepID=UPI00286E53D7|nr:hypothetical protein [Sphaerotilus sp.]